MRKKILAVVLSAAAILLCVVGFGRSEVKEGFYYVSDADQGYAALSDAVVIFCRNELRLYDLGGEVLLCTELSMQDPQAEKSDDICIVWDSGGSEWLYLRADGEYLKGAVDGKLLYAQPTESGYLLCEIQNESFVLTALCDKAGELIFRYGFPSGGEVIARLSPDEKHLAVQSEGELRFVSAENGSIVSKVQSTAKDMYWTDNDTLMTVSDKAVHIFSVEGDTYKYEADGFIRSHAFSDENAVIFVGEHESGGKGELVCLSPSLTVRGKTETNEVFSLDIGSRGILVQERDSTVLYGTDMRIRDKTEVNSALLATFASDDALIIQKGRILLW